MDIPAAGGGGEEEEGGCRRVVRALDCHMGYPGSIPALPASMVLYIYRCGNLLDRLQPQGFSKINNEY